jgi:Recombination endonuclease VII
VVCNVELSGRGYGRTCARQVGHSGQHASAEARERNLQRQRGPGQCGTRGCTRPKLQYKTGNFDIQCAMHFKKRWKSPQRVATTRNSELKRRYGISLDEYNQLLKKQRGRCAICHTSKPNGKDSMFYVDHDHKTGAVRGLLCHSCNIGLGCLSDNPARLRAAADYLDGV